MDKNERKKHVLKIKFRLFLAIVVILGTLLLFGYRFDNRFVNGVLIIIIMFNTVLMIQSEKFYIEFGIRETDLEEDARDKELRLFAMTYPFTALYNKLVAISFFLSVLVGVYLMVSYFFQ